MTYRFVTPTGNPAELTAPQLESLKGIAARWNLTQTVEVLPLFGGDGCVMVNVGTMWLGVELDGYTHS